MIANLYEHQKQAVEKMHNGCILVGGVGSGKSRTALYYYWRYVCDRMKRPKNLYIITTARKRNSLEWDGEVIYFGIDPHNEDPRSPVKVVIDSWNNLHKYKDVKNAFFIFDEQKVVGYGAWAKAFLTACRQNQWVLLSATPGDTWIDYLPVFIANGFYRNKTEFIARHVIYSRFAKYPQIERYINEDRLIACERKVVVNMEYSHHMQSHVEMVECDFDAESLMRVYRGRWNVFENTPVMQAGEWCYVMREVVNSHHTRLEKILDIFEEKKRIIVFYNFDYELEVLRDGITEYIYGVVAKEDRGLPETLRSDTGRASEFALAEYNGHVHNELPTTKRWIYLVQYNAASEAWNCITTDTIVFYSLNYSYKIMEQASGRIRRMNSPYSHLYYYVLYSRSIIDKSILTALKNKKNFNERRMYNKIFDGGN